MNCRLLLRLLTLLTLSTSGAAQQIPAHELTDRHVAAAVTAIIAELHARKDPVTLWEPTRIPSGESAKQGGGTTALVVYALLSAGQSYQDPRLRDAVEYLENHGMNGTYAVAMRAHVWASLPDRFRPLLVQDAEFLSRTFNRQSRCWDYTSRARNYEDNSIRQYGALAMWQAARRDVETNRQIWRALEDAALEQQNADGGWSYRPGEPSTGSMTTAGLTILYLTRDVLHRDQFRKLNQSAGAEQDAIDRGLEWLQQRFSPETNPGLDDYFYYYLYGIERVGLASGRKTFGNRDWFRLGAAELIHRLCDWNPDTSTMSVHDRAYGRGSRDRIKSRELAFALLFLSRGRVPTAINKLRTDDLTWNNRPADVSTLVARIADNTETRLNWQVIDTTLPAEQWIDAPLLYFASHEQLPWIVNDDATLPDELTRLRRALNLGGTLLAVNEGRRTDFAQSIETAGTLMFPDLAWSDAAPDHWAYTIGQPSKGRRLRLRVLNNGVRDLIVLVPRGDVPASLQSGDRPDDPAWSTLTNLYLYASERNRALPRLGADAIARTNARPQRTVTIARARHAGQWNPEPLALEVFDQWLRRTRDIRLTIVETDIPSINELPQRPTLLVVEGIDAVAFDHDTRESLRAYMQTGGVVLFTTPGGTGEFTTSATTMCENILDAESTLMLAHPIVTAEQLDGTPSLTRIGYRAFALEQFGSRETAPRLRGISTEGQLRCLFSNEDITHALLGRTCWGVAGYDTPSARALLGNIVRFVSTPHATLDAGLAPDQPDTVDGSSPRPGGG